ncbi:hypothetical protein [Pseudomonas phage PSA11]|uniref:RNA polymerase sigma factor n=1 Tax=Pseudomonas phage PA11 TaxID=347327 RepID=UPI000155435C|nr:RNA polymerase sigma factor [Pseudomonas phage PA11]QVJ12717.1 hypothetical protein [Pseudomonas phage PSA11]
MVDVKARNLIMGRFFKNNYNELVKRVSFRAGTPENAEDIVQEAFARALKYWNSYDPERKELGAWFNSILNNALRDFKRDERRYGMCEEFDEEEVDGVVLSQTESGLRKFIDRAIAERPSNVADVLHLYFILGYKPREIVEVTDADAAFVSRMVYNFREELKGQVGID